MVSSLRVLLKFIGHSLLVLWLVLTLVHVGLSLASGNPVELLVDSRLSQVQQAKLEKKFGYDATPLERYGRYLMGMSQADFGISFIYKTPVVDVLLPRMGKSLLLGSLAMFLALVFAIGLLWLLHLSPTRWLRLFGDGLLQVGLAVPAFVWAPILLAWLARDWGWFPAYGSSSLFKNEAGLLADFGDRFWHAFLPALCLAFPLAGQIVAYLHEQLRAIAAAPFILSARGRGVGPHRVFWNHQMRHVLPSLVQWLGLYLPILAGGAVVIETIFGWPGLGLVLFDAVLGRDYPLLLGGCIWVTCLVVPCYLIADWYRDARLEPNP